MVRTIIETTKFLFKFWIMLIYSYDFQSCLIFNFLVVPKLNFLLSSLVKAYLAY